MRILLVHTGGTIGMCDTPNGFAPMAGVVEDAVQSLIASGECAADVMIHTLEPLIDSAQATPADWIRVAQCIHDASDASNGVVVTHGTDTLAYTAGALCLLLAGLDKPVIVTGAMLPLTVAGSDGLGNLRAALDAAGASKPGVWVQFAGRLLHGARVRKSHSSAFDAFAAETSEVAPLFAADHAGLNALSPQKVGVFSVTPGPCTDVLAFAVDHCDGLVLRCYGSGTAPDTLEMRAALGRARQRKIPVIAVSQCPEGGMKLGTYAAGQVMRDNNVVDGRDMTPEMAYVKMQVALSLHSTYQARCDFLVQNQVGEFGL
ncbi:asparaginase [Loktanella agnita]|uniref:asparaginase n=1 Tax=Loktanella agnita TaxID=287097 RepID=UPI003987B1F4